jgi:hypothetical protein
MTKIDNLIAKTKTSKQNLALECRRNTMVPPALRKIGHDFE